MSENNFVYRVMKNSDFTEGRGPMVYVATFGTFEAANNYVMHKGSPYGGTLKVDRDRSGKRWDYEAWYTIHKDEVLQSFDIEQAKADRKELKQLEERVAFLRERTKL